MKTIIPVLSIFALLTFACNGQSDVHSGQKVKWMSFEAAVKANQMQPKKILIDVYTDWCGWCKKMDATTFMNDSVSKYLNEKYYSVKLDAEMKDSVVYNGYVFKYKPEFKCNELAMSLLQGKMSYPTFVVMDEKFNLLSPVPGYKSVSEIMPVLKYFGENTYLNQSWEDFAKAIKPE